MVSKLLLLCLVLPIISYPPQEPVGTLQNVTTCYPELASETVKLVTCSDTGELSFVSKVGPSASISFGWTAEEIVKMYDTFCWEDRCVPMEVLLTFIDQEGR